MYGGMDNKTLFTGILIGITIMAVGFHIIGGKVKARQKQLVQLHSEGLIRSQYLQGNLTQCKSKQLMDTIAVEGKTKELTDANTKVKKELDDTKKLLETAKKNVTAMQETYKNKVQELENKLNESMKATNKKWF